MPTSSTNLITSRIQVFRPFKTMVMKMWKKFVDFLTLVIRLAKNICLFTPGTRWPESPQLTQSPPESQTIQILQTNPTNPTDQPPPRPGDGRPLLVMGVCFTGVGLALHAFQTSKPLPMAFHCCCMLLELSFISVILSIYIRPLNQLASLVMDHAAILLGSTAFMLAISMNFPSPFLAISMAIYFVLVLLVIVANIFRGS